MKLLILAACAALAAADVSHVVGKGDQDAQIVSQDLDVGLEGKYQWSYTSDNGIAVRASGTLKNPEREDASQAVQGDAQWTAPDGQLISFEYIADENGYQPQGAHIPTPPPIPPAILRSLEYIRAHPPAVEKN